MNPERNDLNAFRGRQESFEADCPPSKHICFSPSESSEDNAAAKADRPASGEAKRGLDPLNLLCTVPPGKIRGFVQETYRLEFGEMSVEQRQMLAEIAKCRYSSELYFQELARAKGKKLIYASHGRLLEEVRPRIDPS